MQNHVTKTLKDSTFEKIFTEITYDQKWVSATDTKIHLFCLDVKDKKFDLELLKNNLYFNISNYVLTRARIEKYKTSKYAETILDQAKRLFRKELSSDENQNEYKVQELGCFLSYIFIEKFLDAPKIITRVDATSSGLIYDLKTENIHFRIVSDDSDKLIYYNQVIIGSSGMVGDIKYAIDSAFKKILAPSSNIDSVPSFLEQTVCDRVFSEDECKYLKNMILPDRTGRKHIKNSYAVFLGYSLGLNPQNHTSNEYINDSEYNIIYQKMYADLTHHIPYIKDIITHNRLDNHSFYFYVLPFDDVEEDAIKIMDDILEGVDIFL